MEKIEQFTFCLNNLAAIFIKMLWDSAESAAAEKGRPRITAPAFSGFENRTNRFRAGLRAKFFSPEPNAKTP